MPYTPIKLDNREARNVRVCRNILCGLRNRVEDDGDKESAKVLDDAVVILEILLAENKNPLTAPPRDIASGQNTGR